MVLVSESELKGIFLGQEYLVKFFRKRTEELNRIMVGDLVYFKKSRGEILGQFEIGKLIIVQSINLEDKRILESLDIKDDYKLDFEKNQVLLIVQISKLEQLIASPIEIPKGRKEWVVLED